VTAPYSLTPEAEDDLLEIWQYIARANPRAADLVEDTIHAACAFLAESPYAGKLRREITPMPVRFWTVSRFPNYVIVYRPETQPLQIIRVLHGQRDLPAILTP